jgi:nucleoside-diphosphate-sugar epimerase
MTVPAMRKHWIVTGANGYLGGELCKGLHRMGVHVHALARKGRPLDALDELGIESHSYEDFSAVLTESCVVVHCAGKVSTEGSWAEYTSVNIDWSVLLFDQSTAAGAKCFVYVSSVAALGYQNRFVDTPLDESAKPQLIPGELYGRSKWLAEQALLKKAQDNATRLIVLRPGFIYGHRPLVRQQTWLRRGTMVDPLQRVPMVHIDSFTAALKLTVDTPEVDGIFFVVDSGQPTLHELNVEKLRLGLMQYHPWRIGRAGFWLLNAARMVVRLSRGQFRRLPKGYSMAQYYFQTRRLLYSAEKLSLRVGWNPNVRLTDGLAECVRQEKTTKARPPLDQHA